MWVFCVGGEFVHRSSLKEMWGEDAGENKVCGDMLRERLCIEGWASQRNAGMEALTPCRGRSRGLGGKLLLRYLMTSCLNTSKLIIYAAKFSLLQGSTAPAWLQKLELQERLKLLNYIFYYKNIYFFLNGRCHGLGIKKYQ